MSWFDPIKNALEVVETDLHNIFAPGGGGFTQANFVKLAMDIESGIQVDLQQVQIGIKAVAVGLQQGIPIAQQAIADAQLVAIAYPAVAPIIATMQASLAAAQALDAILLNETNTSPATIPDGVKVLTQLAGDVASWAKEALATVKGSL